MKVNKKKQLELTPTEWAYFGIANEALVGFLRDAKRLRLVGDSLDAMHALEEAVQGCEAFSLIAAPLV